MMCAMRADAVRNRARILAAAHDLVAETGADAPIDEIARRAGVAVGTLYRHFPAKDDLVTAAVTESTRRIALLAEAALHEVDGGAAPGPLLERLIGLVAERHAADRVFREAAGRLEEPAASTGRSATPAGIDQRAATAMTELLHRARADGAVRPDIDLGDLVLLLAGIPGPGVPPERRARYLDVVLAGLRPGAGRAVP